MLERRGTGSLGKGGLVDGDGRELGPKTCCEGRQRLERPVWPGWGYTNDLPQDASRMGAHVDRVPAGPKNTGDDGRGLDIVPLIPFKISEWTQTVGKPTGGFPEAGSQHPRFRRFEHGTYPQNATGPLSP